MHPGKITVGVVVISLASSIQWLPVYAQNARSAPPAVSHHIKRRKVLKRRCSWLFRRRLYIVAQGVGFNEKGWSSDGPIFIAYESVLNEVAACRAAPCRMAASLGGVTEAARSLRRVSPGRDASPFVRAGPRVARAAVRAAPRAACAAAPCLRSASVSLSAR